MSRPVWLFSQDSEGFCAAPTTTGGLKAYYLHYGENAQHTDIQLLHFADREDLFDWTQHSSQQFLACATEALQRGQQPVCGFSFYTWNAAEFLELARFLKQLCPDLLLIAGGPHVQQAEDYLFDECIDVIILGEGEQTFTELMDAKSCEDWQDINGLAFLSSCGELITTRPRDRITELDRIPSALEVVALTDSAGKPLYDSVSYETSRGCPYKCAFCEWGTGAIGGKMYQFSLDRIERDWHRIIAAGIRNIWLADSNFGALKQDTAKAELICQLKRDTGLPSTFATSWSKKHNDKVQNIALMLHHHGLLPHYQLALQTLTPLALELSHRKNMAANKFQPIAKQMAEAGVPIAAELIWALPGDNLRDFETNLDRLLAIFPNINIFGYTLLPGTEFYRRREEYQIKSVPVAGYGKARGEYVVGCHTFGEEEGREGYFLITAHILLVHGCIMPLTTRFLALLGDIPVSPLLRQVLRRLIASLSELKTLNDPLSVYENRAALYLNALADFEHCYRIVKQVVVEWLQGHGADTMVIQQCVATLAIDKAFCPRSGAATEQLHSFEFDVLQLRQSLEAMELPATDAFFGAGSQLLLRHPGGLGDILKDPDGAGWMKSVILKSDAEPLMTQPVDYVQVLQPI